MSKQTGLGDNYYVDLYDLSGDTNSLGAIAGGNTPIDVTGIDKSAFERLGGLRDGRVEWVSYFNDASGQEHPALSPLTSSDRIVSYFRGTAIGSPAASMVGKQINYDPTRAATGELTIAVQALANAYGLEWGLQATAGKRTDASATAAAGVTALDGTAGTNFGLQAYLHVFSLGSGTPTVKLQESSDNGADAYADVTGGTFGAVTAGSYRIATATNLAVERYLKVVTTGTFTNLVFAVQVVRNAEAPTF